MAVSVGKSILVIESPSLITIIGEKNVHGRAKPSRQTRTTAFFLEKNPYHTTDVDIKSDGEPPRAANGSKRSSSPRVTQCLGN